MPPFMGPELTYWRSAGYCRSWPGAGCSRRRDVEPNERGGVRGEVLVEAHHCGISKTFCLPSLVNR